MTWYLGTRATLSLSLPLLWQEIARSAVHPLLGHSYTIIKQFNLINIKPFGLHHFLPSSGDQILDSSISTANVQQDVRLPFDSRQVQ